MCRISILVYIIYYYLLLKKIVNIYIYKVCICKLNDKMISIIRMYVLCPYIHIILKKSKYSIIKFIWYKYIFLVRLGCV